MILKEITKEEALEKLCKEGIFKAYVENSNSIVEREVKISGINLSEYVLDPFISDEDGFEWEHCYIEVEE